jgi:hypothetical protein
MDSDFDAVRNFVSACQNLEYYKWWEMIDCKCKISYVFNGEKFANVTKTEYVNRLRHGHFENTTSTEVIASSITRLAENLYSTFDVCKFTRKGYGKDENGVGGVYIMRSEGTIEVKDGKIISMKYNFVKTLQTPDESSDYGSDSD